MSWSVRLTHTTTGLAMVFAGPVTRLDMTPDVARHLAALLAGEAAQHRGHTPPLDHAIWGDRKEAALNEDLAAKPRFGVIGNHPLCCNCDTCLNGDDDA